MKKLEPKSEIFLVFTADTEYTPPWKSGSWVQNGPDQLNRRGLKNIESVLSKNSILGTFLLEGILAKNDSEVVLQLEGQGHEIGYHGFAHESYGGAWKTTTAEQPAILTRNEVKHRIAAGSEVIKNLTGRAPKSFVAPFHHVRKSTMRFLGDQEFHVDSSFYNHLYGLKEPFEIICANGRSIIEIPFSVPLRPKWRMGISPFFPTILEAALDDFDRTTADLPLSSNPENTTLCLLLTCHPWELVDEKEAKFRTLQKLLDYLIGVKKALPVTMEEFSTCFGKQFKNHTMYAI